MVNLIDRNTCPLCNTEDGRLLTELPLDRGPVYDFLNRVYSGRLADVFSQTQKFALYQCPHCDFAWQRWILDEAGMNLLYDRWIDPSESRQKNRTHPASYYLPLFRDVLWVTTFFPGKKPFQIRTLDFGMGWGGWTRIAMAMGLDAWGSELSQSRIENAKAMGIPLFNDFTQGSEQFDYINTEQVLEHIPDIHTVMNLLYRQMKRGGILRFSVPPVRKELSLIRKKQWQPGHEAFHPLEHINGFTWKSIKYLADRHRLNIASPFFFIKLMVKHPKEAFYIFKRMLSHFFLNNVILIKK